MNGSLAANVDNNNSQSVKLKGSLSYNDLLFTQHAIYIASNINSMCAHRVLLKLDNKLIVVLATSDNYLKQSQNVSRQIV